MTFTAKVRGLGTVFLAAFLLVILKLGLVQVILAARYEAAAEKQHFYTLEIPARRGEIKTSDGFPLAADKDDFLFYVNLSKFTDNREAAADKLASILVADVPFVATDAAMLKAAQKKLAADLAAKFGVKNAVWVNLAHFVKKDSKEQIEKLSFPGLGFIEEQSRDYPEASMAAHTLGFVGFDTVGKPKGYFGLEGYYEQELSGKAGELRIEKDALGRPIAIGSETRRDKQDGRNLITTIDRSVQRFTEKALEDGIKDWKAGGGTAIVMDPKTGAILAMASFPRYDPDNFSYYATQLYKNPAIADLYEPGSIIKPLVMAAAINENAVKADTHCDQCGGPRKIGEYYIHTFNDQYRSNLNMSETLINSDNTGMVFVGEKLGYDKLYSYFKKYGFGKISGIDLQEEEEGSLRDLKDLYPIDKATLTFGQGVAVNAMQMMKAWSVLANGGVQVQPHLVSEVLDKDKKISLKWPAGSRIVSATTAKVLTEMLVRVARESPVHYPLDRFPQLVGFRIAAKSGTAEISLGGKYQKKGTIASVIGFFPADDPKFLVMVKLNEPEVRPWGSDTAGPVFAAITRDLLYYYGITP